MRSASSASAPRPVSSTPRAAQPRSRTSRPSQRSCERALSLGVEDPHDQVLARFELGQALNQTRRPTEAESVLTEAHELASRLGHDEIAALALVQRAWNRTGTANMDFNDALAVSEKAIDVLTRTGDDLGLALARRLRGHVLGSLSGSTDAVGEELELSTRPRAGKWRQGDAPARDRDAGQPLPGRGATPAGAAIERCEQLLDVGARRPRARGDGQASARPVLRDGVAAGRGE